MLARGAEGPNVVTLQRSLRALGWQDVIIDGKFGLYTDCAVRQEQHRLNLRADGVVGPITGRALLAAQPLPGRTAVRVRLPVTFRSQRDNRYAPSSTCNVTSFAMALAYLGVPEPRDTQLEDHLYRLITSDEGMKHLRESFAWANNVAPWTVHGMLTWVAAQMGVKSSFKTTATWSEVRSELDQKRPVVLSAMFTGSGHIVCLSGYGGESGGAPDVLIADDPWGDWNPGYRERDGSDRVYTRVGLEGIGCKSGQIWAHFFG